MRISQPTPRKTAGVIALVYTLLGTIWILGSDNLVEVMGHESPAVERFLQSTKGIFYIISTGIALFFAVAWALRTHERTVAEKRRAEEMFSVASKFETLGQLAGNLAHDFNNVLTVIGCATYGTRLESGADDTVRKSIAHAQASIAALMKFSRREPLDFRVVDCGQHLNESAPLIRQALGGRYTLEVHTPVERILIRGLPNMMVQVLLNLATNARDAMARQPKRVLSLTLTKVSLKEYVSAFQPVRVTGDFACLRVKDTGCGIPPENLSKIFEPLFTTKSPEKGTGLGLASVRHVITQLNGWVEVSSNVGVGTEFALYVPTITAES